LALRHLRLAQVSMMPHHRRRRRLAAGCLLVSAGIVAGALVFNNAFTSPLQQKSVASTHRDSLRGHQQRELFHVQEVEADTVEASYIGKAIGSFALAMVFLLGILPSDAALAVGKSTDTNVAVASRSKSTDTNFAAVNKKRVEELTAANATLAAAEKTAADAAKSAQTGADALKKAESEAASLEKALKKDKGKEAAFQAAESNKIKLLSAQSRLDLTNDNETRKLKSAKKEAAQLTKILEDEKVGAKGRLERLKATKSVLEQRLKDRKAEELEASKAATDASAKLKAAVKANKNAGINSAEKDAVKAAEKRKLAAANEVPKAQAAVDNQVADEKGLLEIINGKTVAAPKPITQAPKPTAQISKPTAQTSKPKAETPKPKAETPKPMAQTEEKKSFFGLF